MRFQLGAPRIRAAACRCQSARRRAVMGIQHPGSGKKACKPGFVDSLLRKDPGFAITVDRIAVRLRSLKLVIVESLHVADPARTMRGPSDRETQIDFMIFPSTRNREVGFKLLLSLRTNCRRCHSGRWFMRTCGVCALTRELHESQLAREYIVAPKQYTFLGGN